MSRLFLSSDNALGSPLFGDVDDAFAIAALLRSGHDVAGLASVFGNTSEARAAVNHHAIADACGWRGPILRGARRAGDAPTEAARALAAAPGPLTVAALGPLTDIAAALALDPTLASRLERVVIVGANRTSRGRWPPWWPHEFNLTHDRAATHALFASAAPIAIVPLDLAGRFRFGPRELAQIPGAAGTLLRRGARRWIVRSALRRFTRAFPIWDLLAAMAIVDPGGVHWERTRATAHPNGWVELAGAGREVELLASFDRDRLWKAFLRRIA